MDSAAIVRSLAQNPLKPLLGICSYCQHVRFPAGSTEGEWMTMPEYTRRGGLIDVRSSHGVCPTCFNQLQKH
jgi:hypothetical protein